MTETSKQVEMALIGGIRVPKTVEVTIGDFVKSIREAKFFMPGGVPLDKWGTVVKEDSWTKSLQEARIKLTGVNSSMYLSETVKESVECYDAVCKNNVNIDVNGIKTVVNEAITRRLGELDELKKLGAKPSSEALPWVNVLRGEKYPLKDEKIPEGSIDDLRSDALLITEMLCANLTTDLISEQHRDKLSEYLADRWEVWQRGHGVVKGSGVAYTVKE